jgi:hypothetical protein
MSIQRFNKAHSASQPTHIYYSLNLINNDSSFPALPVQFSLKDTRSNDFLKSPQDYFMSIVRFNLQTPTLPVFIPQIDLNPNTNRGGTYPIAGMGAQLNTTAPFTVRLYNQVPFPVGSVVYLGYNANTPSTIPAGDTCATALQYYRCTNVSTASSAGLVTVLTLSNTSGVSTGNPSLYPASANFAKGATQVISFASLPATSLVYNAGTGDLTIGCAAATIGTFSSLADFYRVGDTIYVQNSGQYNGVYTAIGVAANAITVKAPRLAGVALAAYSGGGNFLPVGDYANTTPYRITLQYTPTSNSSPLTTYSVTQQLIYQPNDQTQVPPRWDPAQTQSLTLTDITSPYYYVYSYNAWIAIVNQALTNAFWSLQGFMTCGYTNVGNLPAGLLPNQTLPASGSTVNTFQAPSMSWDSANLKAIITADNVTFGQSVSNGNVVFMYANTAFSTLFDGFPYLYPNVQVTSPLYSQFVFNLSAGAGIFIVTQYTSAGVPVVGGTYSAIQIFQDHQTASLMNPIQAIVFTSTILPVVNENVGTPVILNGTSTSVIQAGSSANIFPIISDFAIPFSAGNTYTPDITYQPSGEYRLIDLYGESPAKQIDISVFWRDQYGLLHPFLVGSGCSGSLKILFRAKDYNNISLEE